MLLTVDTSAVAADESTKPALVEATRGAELVASSSLTAEVRNALSAMFKRGRISVADAERVLVAYRAIPIRLVEIDLVRAVPLAGQLDVYAYDAYVIDCALSTGSPLLSLDGGQCGAAELAGVSLHPYSDRP